MASLRRLLLVIAICGLCVSPEQAQAIPAVLDWSPPVSLYNGAGTLQHVAIATDALGQVHVLWQLNWGQIWHTMRRIDGTWTTAQRLSLLGADSRYPAIAADAAGGVHAVWAVQTTAERGTIYYASHSTAGSWSTPIPLLDNTWLPTYPDVAVDGQGGVHVVWQYGYNGENDLSYCTKPAGGAWQPCTAVWNTPAGAYSPALAVDTADVLHLVWNQNLTRVDYSSKTPGGAWTAPSTVHTVANHVFVPDIVSTAGNTLVVAWKSDDTGAEAIYAKERVGAGAWSAPMMLSASDPVVRSGPALAAKPAGQVLVMWGDGSHPCYVERLAGGVWDDRACMSPVGSETAVYADAGGVYHATWLGTGIWYARSPAEATTYGEGLDRLQTYFNTQAGPPPNARSLEWGVYHDYYGEPEGAIVQGGTTTETEMLAFNFEALVCVLRGDCAGRDGTYSYLRRYLLPHDGVNDQPHNGPYQPPGLSHWLIDVDGGTVIPGYGTMPPNTLICPYEDYPIDPDPDRPCYVNADDYVYADAPDADQWWVEGLCFSHAYQPSAERAALARQVMHDLEPLLTTERNSCWTCVDDFEDGDIGDWWTPYSWNGGSLVQSLAPTGADGTQRSLRFDFTVPSNSAGAGTGKDLNADWTPYTVLTLWLRGQGTVRVQLKDAEGEFFYLQISVNTPSAFSYYSAPWSEFVYNPWAPQPPGNHTLDLNLIQALEFEFPGTQTGTLYVDEIELAPGPGSPPPGQGSNPGVMKFSLGWTQAGRRSWEGPLYTGYQAPAAAYLAGERRVAIQMTDFLAAAQLAYDAQDPSQSNLGPFMPIYIQDLQYSGDNPKRLGWTWNGSRADPNTNWAEFQFRTFAHTAAYYFLSGDPTAGQVALDFRDWLKTHSTWNVLPANLALPIALTPNSEAVQTLGYSPGVFGLAAQGLIYLTARDDDPAIRADAEAVLNALLTHQSLAGGTSGAFPSTDGARFFGYQNAEAGLAMALYELLVADDAPARPGGLGQSCQTPCNLADIDDDGDVDVADINAAANAWGTASFSPLVDLDGNSAVNVVDVMLVARAWGATCP